MLLAMELRNRGEEPLIVLVNQMLYEQFNFDNSLYFSEDKLKIQELQYLTPNDCLGKHVILDEADFAIDKYSVYFPTTEPLGLVSMKTAKQLYFLSATYDDFHRQYLRDIFSISGKQHLVFKSTHQLINGVQYN